MVIHKVINNNIAISIDSQGDEIILIVIECHNSYTKIVR
ncbi:CAT RNA binding domain-containing protein [Terribacillus saccharophilus]